MEETDADDPVMDREVHCAGFVVADDRDTKRFVTSLRDAFLNDVLVIAFDLIAKGEPVREKRNAAELKAVRRYPTRPKLLGTTWHSVRTKIGTDQEVGLSDPDGMRVRGDAAHFLTRILQVARSEGVRTAPRSSELKSPTELGLLYEDIA